MEWVDLRVEVPWLGPRPFWIPHEDGSRLRASLGTLRFEVFETSGSPLSDDEGLRRDIALAMDLADHAALNWNAFVDAFGDHVRHTTKPIALIWMDPARSFSGSLALGLGLHATLSSILGDWNRMGPECHQVELFLQGPDRVGP